MTYCFTDVMARAVAVFLCTTLPNLTGKVTMTIRDWTDTTLLCLSLYSKGRSSFGTMLVTIQRSKVTRVSVCARAFCRSQLSPHLNWINVMCNDDKLCFLLLHQASDVLDTILHCNWFLVLAACRVFTLCFLLSQSSQTLLFLSFGLRTILIEQSEQLSH